MDDTHIYTVAVSYGDWRKEPVRIFQITLPKDVTEAAFLAQLRNTKDARCNAYDTSPDAALRVLCRKHGYALSQLDLDHYINYTRTEWTV